jgi:CHAP domain
LVIIAMLVQLRPVRSFLKLNIATTTTKIHSTPEEVFPEVDKTNLTEKQLKILAILQTEYAKHPKTYDANVLKYTEGAKEAWCANFATWVFNEIGSPVKNPYSGSWRIPGVYTLKEYYEAKSLYAPAGNYSPKLGDSAFFIGKGTLDPSTNSHVSIVIKVEGDTVTTIAGNVGGHMRLDQQKITLGENQLVGFGKLE